MGNWKKAPTGRNSDGTGNDITRLADRSGFLIGEVQQKEDGEDEEDGEEFSLVFKSLPCLPCVQESLSQARSHSHYGYTMVAKCDRFLTKR